MNCRARSRAATRIWCFISITSHAPMVGRARPSGTLAPFAPGWRTAGWRAFSRTGCTSSSASLSPTITAWVPRSASSIWPDDCSMRLSITHSTRYCYRRPATGAIQILRVTPRNHDGQYIVHWRIDLSRDCWLHQHEDAFGNVTHTFTTDGPIQELAVTAEGEVETRDTEGIIRDSVERFPPSLFLRQTALTSADENIASFTAACREESGEEQLELLHVLLERLHE